MLAPVQRGLVDGALLGYFDLAMAVPATLAVVAATAGVAWLAGALYAVALLT